MENESRPYWEWPLDRLNILIISAALTLLLGLSIFGLVQRSQTAVAPDDATATAVAQVTATPAPGDIALTPSPDATGTVPDDLGFALTLPITTSLSITEPAEGSLLVTPLVRIEGVAPAGQSVLGFDRQNTIGQTTADAAGLWSLELGAPLSEGDHRLWMALLDTNQAPFARSPIITVTVSTLEAPVIVEPADGSTVTAYQAQIIRGAAAPDERVQVFIDDIPLGDTVADASGSWQFTVTQPLLLGPRRLRADLLDADGRTLAAGIPVRVLILP